MSKITKKQRANYWYKRINKLIDGGKHTFAEDVLFSIGTYIEDNEHITDKQIEAVKNISGGVLLHEKEELITNN